MYWDHIAVEAREIEKVLLQQRAAPRTGPTILEIAQGAPIKGKNEYTPEEKAAYKARKTSEALAHCQREREKVLRREKEAGFTF